jgi:hypothetical protein
MAYNVIATASVSVSSSLNNVKHFLKLPEASFGTRQAPIYAYNITSRIPAASYEDFNLAAQGFTAPRVLLVKSTRPVRVTFTTASTSYTSLLSTFTMHVVDTSETPLDVVTSIRVQVPAQPLSLPAGQPPEGYPAALVELFVAAGDS